MSLTKTPLDLRRAETAVKLRRTAPLGVDVIAGGAKGPYTVVVTHLNEREARRLLRALSEMAAKLGR